ncbi:MAG: peptidoglycan-binding domain-containing protein [Polyangiaceae bacterium]
MKEGAPLELAMPLSAVATILFFALLEVDWEKDELGKTITSQYSLEWLATYGRGSRSYVLASLGYLAGTGPEPRPPFWSPARAASDEQAVLQFQADHGLVQDGALTPATVQAMVAAAATR